MMALMFLWLMEFCVLWTSLLCDCLLVSRPGLGVCTVRERLHHSMCLFQKEPFE